MSLSFQPKSEKEIREAQLAPDGDYDFEVLKSEDATSKSGNPMIRLKLGIYNGDAMRWHVSDYLVAAMEAKLRHFADTTGLLARYESGQMSAQDCTGRAGRCRLAVEEDKEGKYPDKNTVKDYIVRPAKPLPGPKPAETPAVAAAADEDDVPF